MMADSPPDTARFRDQRLDDAWTLLEAPNRTRAPGLLILSACVGLAVALVTLVGTTLLAPPVAVEAAAKVAEATVSATSSSPAFELSSSTMAASPAGSEGLRQGR